VEFKNERDGRDNGSLIKVIHKISEQHGEEAKNQGSTVNRYIGRYTHNALGTNLKKQSIQREK
jgi:hypothetical protein